MAEAIPVIGIGLAIAPFVKAVSDLVGDSHIRTKLAGALRLSSQSQSTRILLRLRRTIEEIRVELVQSGGVLPAEQATECITKLNGTIQLYNDLVTTHPAVDAKTRLDAIRIAGKASTRLLQEVKNLSRKYANQNLAQSVKKYLHHSQNITVHDGTIATYHRDITHNQLPSSPTESPELHMVKAGPDPALQSFLQHPTASEKTSIPPASIGSPQRIYIPIDILVSPRVVPTSSHSFSVPDKPQMLSVNNPHDLLGSISAGVNEEPLIDCSSAGECASLPGGGNVPDQPVEFFFMDFSDGRTRTVAENV
ncbi:hypothetical protein DL96DRAFT_1631568 [Flagelloscypha sp. PMI_526]|nr:hypothetical protein DL96DRAFT_1631568 [Flagelloscypha sp. PMI_526]